MDYTTTELFGIRLSNLTLDAALEAIRERCEEGRGGYVCFVNVHTLTESISNTMLRSALLGASYCFPDGMPLVWLSQLKGQGLAERVAGPDFMAALLRRDRTQCHGFIGGRVGCAEKLVARFGVQAITYSPPMRPYSRENAMDDWRAFLALCPGGVPPRIVWVGLGAPKQEQWLHTISAHAPQVMFFGVGAAFDFLAGIRPRAPQWLQRNGLEWAYRLADDPRRLWKRYLVSGARFAILSIGEVVGARSPWARS